MLNMSEKTREFLKRYLPDTLDAADVNDILIPLYLWIDMHGFTEDYEYNELGKLGQEVYDDLYYNND